jgi:hypothetical protein
MFFGNRYLNFFLLFIITALSVSLFLTVSIHCPKKSPLFHETAHQHNHFTISASHYSGNFLHHFLLGKHYRTLWDQPIKVKEMHVSPPSEDYIPGEMGGNMQTLSIKLKSRAGRSYVLRSVDKNPSQALPEILRNTFVSKLFCDQTSAMHPYGALIVSHLAEKAGLLHPSPMLYVIRPDLKLPSPLKLLAGQIVFFEETPDTSWAGTERFRCAHNIISTEHMLQLKFSGNDSVKIDHVSYLQCRMLDILIGDWDRHAGQYKWAEFYENGNHIFSPIPRDRDMAFYLFDDGLINRVALFFVPKLQSFHSNLDHIEHLVYNGKYLDLLLLSTLEKKDFLQAAALLVSKYPDSVLTNAARQLPPEIFKINGADIVRQLISRRDQLGAAAEKFYNIITENPMIVATDRNELITVTRTDTNTSIELKDLVNGIRHIKTFNNDQTGSIKIYAMGGNDHILITGITVRGPVVKIFGGTGKDTFTDISWVKGSSKKNWLSDDFYGTTIIAGMESRDIRSKQGRADLNRFGKRIFQ